MTNCNGNEIVTTNAESANVAVKKSLILDFLYLDLSICDRCQKTYESISDSLDNVTDLLNEIGYAVTLNKIHIDSEEQAIEHTLLSSPTIRINGEDIQMDVKESHCSTCSSLASDASVDCRIWLFEGEEFLSPPKALIIDAILSSIYVGSNSVDKSVNTGANSYQMPENLKKYFSNQDELCVSDGLKTTEESCCEPSCCK